MKTDTKEKRQQKRHKNPLTEKIGGRSMSILTSKRFQKYFVPGIVFQSCVIAGGYGTGRELVEYFMGYGWLARHVYRISAGVVPYLCDILHVCTNFQKI